MKPKTKVEVYREDVKTICSYVLNYKSPDSHEAKMAAFYKWKEIKWYDKNAMEKLELAIEICEKMSGINKKYGQANSCGLYYDNETKKLYVQCYHTKNKYYFPSTEEVLI